MIAVLAALAATSARAQTGEAWTSSPAVGLGPIGTRADSPLTLFRLQPTPMVPEVLAKGQWQVGLMSGWDNYFDYKPGHFIIDVETLRLTTSIGVGLGKGFDLAAVVPVSYRGGGVMDSFIEHFEKLLGVPNKDRLLFPNNNMTGFARLTHIMKNQRILPDIKIHIYFRPAEMCMARHRIPDAALCQVCKTHNKLAAFNAVRMNKF